MSSNLAGINLICGGGSKLRNIYKKILLITAKFPKEAAYKVNLEAIICHRLSIVNEAGEDRKKIEDNICCGTLEMLVLQAQAEFHLVQKMLLWKPWEPLVEKPPPDQWKWPPS